MKSLNKTERKYGKMTLVASITKQKRENAFYNSCCHDRINEPNYIHKSIMCVLK